MAEGLANLVEGFVKGKDQQMKKAREMADKAAEDWSRQFKVQQAKDDAAQQQIVNQQNAARIKLEQQAQSDREADKKTAADQKKRDSDLRESYHKAVLDIAAKKLDVSTQEKLDKAIVDLTYKFETGGLGHEEAKTRALDTIQAGVSYGQGTGLPMPAQPQQPTQQPPTQTGNPIMDALHQMQQGRGAGQPAQGVGSQVLPKAAAEAALQQAKTEQAQATAQKQKAMADLLTENKELNQRAIQAKTALTEANKRKADEQIAHMKAMEPMQIAELKARTIKLGIDAQVEVSNAKVNVLREQRQQAESDLKSNPSDATAKNRLLDALNKARTSHLHLNEEMMKNVQHSASLDAKIQKAQKDGDMATMRTATDMKKATDNQLADLTNSYREQLQEYTAAQKAVKEFGLREVTTPSRGTAHKANAADTRALDKAASDAQRLQPMFHLDPLSPMARQLVNSGKSRHQSPAPKKKIEKKKGKVVYSQGGITIREK